MHTPSRTAPTGRAFTLALILALSAVAAQAQAPADKRVPTRAQDIKLSGPRFGITILTEEMRAKALTEKDIKVSSVITQFGWQWERQFLGTEQGLAAVNEWIVLVGGLDQGLVIPSASWIVGIRGSNGLEFGVGPNASPSGLGLVLAGGATFRAGALNIPLNLAFVPTSEGVRTSVITGFTLNK